MSPACSFDEVPAVRCVCHHFGCHLQKFQLVKRSWELSASVVMILVTSTSWKSSGPFVAKPYQVIPGIHFLFSFLAANLVRVGSRGEPKAGEDSSFSVTIGGSMDARLVERTYIWRIANSTLSRYTPPQSPYRQRLVCKALDAYLMGCDS